MRKAFTVLVKGLNRDGVIQACAILAGVGFGLALPLYEVLLAETNREVFAVKQITFWSALGIVCVFWLLPSLPLLGILAGLRRIWQKVKVGAGFSALVAVIGAFLYLSAWYSRQFDGPLEGSWLRLVLVLAGLTAAVMVLFRSFKQLFVVLAAVVLTMNLYFVGASLAINMRLAAAPRSGNSPVSYQGKPAEHPIFIILFDELASLALMDENHQIDKLMYPNFHALAQGATWYRNASTLYPTTTKSISSLMSGRPYDEETMGGLNFKDNLFNALYGKYRVEMYEAHTHFNDPDRFQTYTGPPTLGSTFGYLLAVYTAAVPVSSRVWGAQLSERNVRRTWGGFKSREERSKYVIDQFDDFVNRITYEEYAAAAVYHYVWFPHEPYSVEPDGTYQNRPSRYLHYKSSGASLEVARNIRRSYFNLIRYCDSLVGRFVAKLKAEGLYDKALIVLMSDHGIGFTAKAQGRGQYTPYRAEMVGSTMLLIKYPKQEEGQIVDATVQIIDIAPTVLDVAGVEPTWKMTGVSLVQNDPPQRERRLHIGNGKSIRLLDSVLDFQLDDGADTALDRSAIGKTMEGFNVVPLNEYGDRTGTFASVTIDEDRPAPDGRRRTVVTAQAWSVLAREKRVPEAVLVVANGVIANVVVPSIYSDGVATLMESVDYANSYWIATIPWRFLKTGKNAITAYNVIDWETKTVVSLARSADIDLKELPDSQ